MRGNNREIERQRLEDEIIRNIDDIPRRPSLRKWEAPGALCTLFDHLKAKRQTRGAAYALMQMAGG